jgi:hypothetical protein
MRGRGDAAVTGLRTGSIDARECVRALARAPARDQATVDHIAPPLPCIEQKGQRQSGARAYWMMPLELGNLVVRPAMMALGPDAYSPHLAGWIIGT